MPLSTTPPQAHATIPELNLPDFVETLRKAGYFCRETEPGRESTTWTCDRLDLEATFVEWSVTNTAAVSTVTALAPRSVASDLFSIVAALPYRGSDPDAAKRWVGRTIPLIAPTPCSRSEATFGAVNYALLFSGDFVTPTDDILTLIIGETGGYGCRPAAPTP